MAVVAATGASRRGVYRHTKRMLIRLVARSWNGPRHALEPSVRHFLRDRPRGYLLGLLRDRAFALAAAATLLALAPATALPPIDLWFQSGGDRGFAIIGQDNGFSYAEQLGHAIAPVGDMNGDGLADLVIGAPFADIGGLESVGRSYVVFGTTGDDPIHVRDSWIGGFAMIGVDEHDYSGGSVAGPGDVNGDEIPDVLTVSGDNSYVIFGKLDTAAVDLADIAAGNGGFVINGTGVTVAGAGDVNSDGLADVIVANPGGDPGGITNAGETYVVFGKADTAPVDLADVAKGSGGFVINGIDPSDFSGLAVAGGGDVNGDGIPDIIVGAKEADPGGHSRAGESYVVFGKADTTPVNLADVAAGNGGFVINGIEADDASASSVANAGDVNGDGLADVIVGAPGADPGDSSSAGESYVVFGKADTTPVELTDVVSGDGGFVINGIDAGDLSGTHVSGAGDLNGDGLADVIVGVPGADQDRCQYYNDASEAYVIVGKEDGAPVALSNVVNGDGGFLMSRCAQYYGDVTITVSGAGDVNGDGLDDVAVGVPGAYGITQGMVWAVFGRHGDLSGDGRVSTQDLLELLGSWGPCPDPCPPQCAQDFDADCNVGLSDLVTLLDNWG